MKFLFRLSLLILLLSSISYVGWSQSGVSKIDIDSLVAGYAADLDTETVSSLERQFLNNFDRLNGEELFHVFVSSFEDESLLLSKLRSFAVELYASEPAASAAFINLAVPFALEKGNSKIYLNLISIAGILNAMADDPEKALEIAYELIDFVRNSKDTLSQQTLGDLYGNIASTFEVLDDDTTALIYQRKNLTIQRKVGDTLDLVSSYHNLMIIFEDLEIRDSVVFYADAVLEIGIIDGEVRSVANAYLAKADILLEDGLFEESIRLRQLCLAEFSSYNYQEIEFTCYSAMALAYSNIDQIDSMDINMDRAEEVLHTSALGLRIHYDFFMMKSECLENIGLVRESFDLFKQAMAIKDSMNTINSKELAIQYKTAEQEAQNEFLTLQNQQNEQELSRQRWLLGIALIILLVAISVGLYIYRLQLKTQKLNTKIAHQAFELSQANKTKDRLFSIIGHDLRGPITSFEAVTGLVKSFAEKNDTQKVNELIQQVDKSAKGIKGLLDSLLNWSLSQQKELLLNIKSLSVKPIIDEIVEIYEDACIAKDLTIISDIDNEVILADYHTFATILRNLISNAIKFSPLGSQIVLKASKTDQFLELTISDKGVGMTPEQIEKAFTIDKSKVRKGTAKETGTGLGLVLVKEFVELNNGKINLYSKKDKGTTFYISLPLAS